MTSSLDFAEALIGWHESQGRKDLPWQRRPTPYRVWVSEIMLQQTQVGTVVPYFQAFMERFPDIRALAAADLDEVLHLWSGLGYYARARNLHRAARRVVLECEGQLPGTLEALIDLPGIGRSTAGAILALSGGQRHAILDGNVKRVLARFHAVAGWPGKREVERRLWELAERHTPARRVDVYTQAIMDLGATVCTRSGPDCGHCPLASACEARREGAPGRYPGRRPRRDRPRRQTRMLLVVDADGGVLLERRPPTGIWGGLWSFPELDGHESAEDWCREHLGCGVAAVEQGQPLRHSFTHFDLDIQPIVAELAATPASRVAEGKRVWYNRHAPVRLGLAAAVTTLLKGLADRQGEESHREVTGERRAIG